MMIKKIFNNNVVLTEDPSQTEMVVMGRGLAFQKKVGDEIEQDKIEKTFISPSRTFADKLSDLLDEIPYEYMTLTKDIVDLANRELQAELNDLLYVSLADHIHFAITRAKDGIFIKNALQWEVKKFYQNEYKVALKALEMLNERTDTELPEDEAAAIALHLINARQDNSGMDETVLMTNIVHDVTNIVKYHFGIEFAEESMNYSRFITHLRYFAYRMLRGEVNESENIALFEQVKAEYPKAYECTKKVQTFLKKQYNMEMSKDEMTYFMIHIQRVTSREKR